MAEKTVAVKLLARVSQYMAAMAAASKATEGLATSASGLTRVGASMQSVGASMTKYVSVPLVALGGASVLMASRFETAFAQMVGLANVPASEVEHLRDAVLSLSGETARSPQELADALYLAASSGLDSADALDVVTLAAKGAAAGMGSTTDVVNLLTGAVASYGAGNLSAAEAADILSSTIREGRAAPDELAGAMGRVLPIAAAMGVSMNQVGGALAFLTNSGIDTDLAVTELRDVLVKLANPGKAARGILEDMGTSADELKAAIAQDGLMGALELLQAHGFEGNIQALGKLMPDIRGLNGLVALLADSSGTLDGIMGKLNTTTGSLGTAFGAVADTDAFRMKQAFADIQVALIQVGAVLLPFVATVAKGISELVGWFSDLPGPVQSVAVALGALAAVGGPVVFMAGSLVKNWAALSSAFSGSTGGIGKAAGALGLLSVAITVGFGAYEVFTAKSRRVEENTRLTSGALDDQIASLFGVAAAAETTAIKIDGVAIANEALSQALAIGNDKLADALSMLNVDAGQTLDILLRFAADPVAAVIALAESFGLTAEQAERLAPLMAGLETSLSPVPLRDQAAAAGVTGDAFDALSGALYDFQSQARQTDLGNIALAFLNGRVQAEGFEGSLVALAEANLGIDTRTAGNAVAIYEEWGRVVGEADPAARATAAGVDELTGSVTAAGDAAAAAVPWWDSLWASMNPKEFGGEGFTQLGNHVSEAVGEIATLAQAQAELNRVASVGPVGESWVGFAENVAGASRNSDDAIAVYQALLTAVRDAAQGFPELTSQLGLSGVAAGDLGKSVLGVVETFDKMRSVKAFGSDFVTFGKTAEDALGGWKDAAAGVGDIMADTSGEAQSAADAMYAFTDAVSAAMGVLTGDPANLAKAGLAVVQGFADMAAAVDDNGTSLDAYTQGGRDNIKMLYDQADSIIAQSEAFLENGYSVEQVSASYTSYRAQLIAAAAALGLNALQVDELLTLYGMTPELVPTAVEVTGVPEAKTKTQDLIAKYDEVDRSIYTEVSTAMAAGDWQTVHSLLAQLAAPIGVPVTPYLTRTHFNVSVTGGTSGFTMGILASAAGRFIPGGSNLLTTTAERGGSQGDEVILPLGDRARMSSLLGMSEVGPRVAAAFGGTGGGGSMSTAIYTTINATVNMPPGANGDDVVRALRKWQRQSGPLPLLTR